MLPNRLEEQVAFNLENPEIVATSCHCYYINKNSQIVGNQFYPHLKTVQDCKNVVTKKQIVLCAFSGMMVAREVFIEMEGLRPQFWTGEDV